MDLYPSLFRPLQLGGLTVPNRIVRTAHGVRAPWVDLSDQLIRYHEARAAGGVGLSILGAAPVDPKMPSGVPVGEDRVVSGYQRLAEAIHAHDATVMQQLYHPGNSAPGPDGGAPWSAGDVPGPLSDQIPLPMTEAMIRETVDRFAAAAVRVEKGGLDGVEIHAGSGYLIQQFLSPLTNRREDRYGGDLEARTLFLREILSSVRQSVGAGFPVGVRLVVDEYEAGGIRPEDSAAIAALIEPMVDFVDLHHGSYYRYHKLLAPGDAEPLGYELPGSGVVSRTLSVPTIVAGRVMTMDDAEQIVRDGIADMVSMVRATIADPALVRRSREGAADRVRPCIGTNEGCVGGILSTGFGCVMNPGAGREAQLLGSPSVSAHRRALVVGGGPAGLEAARALATAGHEVTLVEARRRLGGQLAIAAQAPHRSDLGAAVAWWENELRRLGVRVRTDAYADPDLIEASGADLVLLATGSSPLADGATASHPAAEVEREPGARIWSSWDVFGAGGRVEISGDAVVYDDAGTFEAISVVEELLERCGSVTLVTRHDCIGARVPGRVATVIPAQDRLRSHFGFRLETGAYLTSVGKRHTTVSRLHSGQQLRIDAGTVVHVGMNSPERELAEILEQSGSTAEIHLIGDASGTRGLQHAVAAGAAAARRAGTSPMRQKP